MNLLPTRAVTPDEEAPLRVGRVGHLFPSVHDPEATEVARLVNEEGWDQWTASYFVHTGLMPPPAPPAWDADRATWSRWVRDHVAAIFGPLRRAVGL